MRMTAILLTAALLPAPALAEIPADLQTLCERLCGGVWRDEQRSGLEYRYERDEAAGLVRGRISNKNGGDTITLFGWDKEKNEIWMIQTVAGDLPSVGTLSLTPDGFSYAMQLYGTQSSYAAQATFTGKDSYSETFSFRGDDGMTGSGGVGPFVRTPN